MVRHALLCGQFLNELKARTPHGQWEKLLAQKLPTKSADTAQRYMRAVERVCDSVLKLDNTIDVESFVVSSALTSPQSPAEEKYQQLFLDFTQDKTIADCLRDVLDGESPDHRITRAANGKSKGGTRGEDRKDFPLFTLVKFRDVGSHLSHWKTLNQTQRAEIMQVLRAAILGDACKLAGRDRALVQFKPWPEEVATVAIEALRERLKTRAK